VFSFLEQTFYQSTFRPVLPPGSRRQASLGIALHLTTLIVPALLKMLMIARTVLTPLAIRWSSSEWSLQIHTLLFTCLSPVLRFGSPLMLNLHS
jgi:hypothetical protein